MTVEVLIDGNVQTKLHTAISGNALTARSTSPEVSVSLFVMPFGDYLNFDPLEKEIGDLKGVEVNMGDLPHLKIHDLGSLSVTLEKGNTYDVFGIGSGSDGKTIAGGGRFVTQEVTEVPYPVTFEEMKFFAMQDLGFTPEFAKQITAIVTPMTAWGGSGRFVIAGFEYAKAPGGFEYGSMVQHNGIVSHYHGYSRDEIRNAISQKLRRDSGNFG